MFAARADESNSGGDSDSTATAQRQHSGSTVAAQRQRQPWRRLLPHSSGGCVLSVSKWEMDCKGQAAPLWAQTCTHVNHVPRLSSWEAGGGVELDRPR